jgi:LmbE family N-acetylglucosaminyl deacetylase
MLFRRTARTVARHVIYPVVEAANLRVLLARKRLGGLPSPARLAFGGGKRVLVLAAHPDDETLGCFGAMLAHSEAGDAVTVVMVTDGSGSRAGGLGPRAMAARRTREVEDLRGLLPRVEIEEWRYPEGGWEESALAGKLGPFISDYSPDILYAPSCVDFHPEHLRLARTFATVLRDRAIRVPVRAYEMQVPLGPELANLYHTLDKRTARLKDRAINLYRSQRGALALWKREARYAGALSGAASPAELFWEMSSESYTRVMEYGSWGWPETPFRSLDGRPLRDLEAYIRSSKVRRKLAELSALE